MSTLCFIDTETTGLDPRIHQPYEVNIGHYWERRGSEAMDGGRFAIIKPRTLASALNGVTLVGSNPAFDAAMLTRYIGAPVWHYRLINVAEGGMWTFGWDRPKGLADVANECRACGYDIPEPDHTAEGDVRTTRAVYEALRAIRGAQR